MATTPIKLKRSHTISVIPDTSDLIAGEVALNTVDKKFYVRDDSNAVVTLANHYATDFDTNVVTFKVTVASSTSAHPYHGTGSSNKYKINGIFSPYLKLIPKITYRFDQSDSSNSGHPLLFYYDAAKATQFSTGVTVVSGSSGPGSAGAYTQIVVSDSTPAVLHYQCSAHGYMGWAATTSTRNLTGFDTDDLSEGSTNLYHTTARVNSAIDSRVNATFINNLTIVADTATALANARTIGGVSFDGTANINLPGVNSSGNQDTSGNAGTATVLATARTIGGVSFNGSADINLPGVNAEGNQNTTGNAATATALATARTLSFTGDVTGTGDFDGSGNLATALTIAANSVALGTDTTGNYMAQVSGGDGITISHTQGEGSTATITGTAIYNVSGTKLN